MPLVLGLLLSLVLGVLRFDVKMQKENYTPKAINILMV